jgi:hypothetical protein
MWSGPRNISTAMMRAWENRPDTVVIDEPLYGYYLARTGLDHPGAAEVMASQCTDWRQVTASLSGPVLHGRSVVYQKHMTHHLLPEIELDWVDALQNCFLIRDPAAVLASYVQKREQADAEDLGFRRQAEIFDHVLARTGRVPPVLEASEVLKAPESQLTLLCRRLGIEFSPRMLHWPSGPRATDGVWARHWYAAVEASTGFTPYGPRETRLPADLEAIAETCRPYYAHLYQFRLTI